MDVCVAFDSDFNCIESFPVTIQAEWEGFGPVRAINNFSPQPGSHFPPSFIGHTNVRDAAATGSVNGQDLGQTDTESANIFRVNRLVK